MRRTEHSLLVGTHLTAVGKLAKVPKRPTAFQVGVVRHAHDVRRVVVRSQAACLFKVRDAHLQVHFGMQREAPKAGSWL